MNHSSKILALAMPLALSAGAGFAQQNVGINGQSTVNTITTAVPFLRISPDSRSGAMGDVGIAISADANSQYWNVAKMPFAPKKAGVALTYTPWLKDLVPDIFLAYISGYTRFGTDTNQAISGSLRYFNLGDITYTENGIDPTGTGKPREFSFDLGYSRKLSPYLSAGVTLRYIHSNIASGINGGTGVDYRPGNAFGADAGVYYTKNREIDEFRYTNFSFGAVVSNLGSRITYTGQRRDFIPANLGLGVAYTSQFDEYNKITLAVDLNKLLVPTPQFDAAGRQFYPDKSVVSGAFSSFTDAPDGFSEEIAEIQASIGAEYWYQNQFAVRAGYFYEDKNKGARKFFSCGLGVRYNVFTLSGSYLLPSGSGITRNPLSNTFRFTLGFEFDRIGGDDKNN